MPADFAVHDATGRVSAVVEARRQRNTSAAWATQLRRNMLVHGLIPADAVFALVTPSRIFLWAGGAPHEDPPAVDREVDDLLGPYFARVGVAPEAIEHEAFELLVSWWLEDLGKRGPGGASEAEAGHELLRALVGARITRQDAA